MTYNQAHEKSPYLFNGKESFLYTIYQDLPIGALTISPDRSILFVNDWVRKYFSYDMHRGEHIEDILNCGNVKKVGVFCCQMMKCEQCMLKKGIDRILYDHLLMDSIIVKCSTVTEEVRWLKICGKPICYQNEMYAVIFLEDITSYQQREQHLTEKLELDLATNTLNKQSLMRKIEKLIKVKIPKPFTICMIDFDDFKKINDFHGHIVGDKVLLAFSQIAHEHIRIGDVIGRYGGEEFILVFMETDLMQSVNIVNRIQKNLRSRFANIMSMPVTLSAGLIYVDENTCSQPECEKLIDQVDSLLYQAKESGKNRVVTPAGEFSFEKNE